MASKGLRISRARALQAIRDRDKPDGRPYAPTGQASAEAGVYYTFIWSGPAKEAGARWKDIAPDRLDCNITFNGPRPDGLNGPNWNTNLAAQN